MNNAEVKAQLSEYRQSIDNIDAALIHLLAERFKATQSVGVLKARMEAERIPRGRDPKLHLKLGRGGLSDVEWTVQMLQMQHAAAEESLRTTSTVEALAALQELGHVTGADAEALQGAWALASDVRDASMLWRGRATDSLPTDPRDREGVSRAMGRPAGAGPELTEEYLRQARRARAVVERLFYDS